MSSPSKKKLFIFVVFEQRLTERFLSTENAVKAAITAKKQAVTAIHHHNKQLLQAVQNPQVIQRNFCDIYLLVLVIVYF